MGADESERGRELVDNRGKNLANEKPKLLRRAEEGVVGCFDYEDMYVCQ